MLQNSLVIHEQNIRLKKLQPNRNNIIQSGLFFFLSFFKTFFSRNLKSSEGHKSESIFFEAVNILWCGFRFFIILSVHVCHQVYCWKKIKQQLLLFASNIIVQIQKKKYQKNHPQCNTHKSLKRDKKSCFTEKFKN